MDQQAESAIVRRAAQLYRAWESRPWYVKLWDRARSQLGYVAFLLRKH